MAEGERRRGAGTPASIEPLGADAARRPDRLPPFGWSVDIVLIEDDADRPAQPICGSGGLRRRPDWALSHLRLTATGRVSSGLGSRQLDWRAWHRAVGTEDAAIARLWPQHHATPSALEEIDAGIDGHCLRVTSAAGGAGQLGAEQRHSRGFCRRTSGGTEGIRFFIHGCYRTVVPEYGVKGMGRDRLNATIGGMARGAEVNVEAIRFYQRRKRFGPVAIDR
jgi:hypothetical protein